MGAHTKGYDLDLTRMGDEELVILYQECRYEPAKAELVIRYNEWKDRKINWLARRGQLPRDEWEDARQDGVLAMIEAIRGYDTLEVAAKGGCSFRTFLNQVVALRFQNGLARSRRRKERFKARLAIAATSDEAILEREEAFERLHTALAQLDAPAREVWECRKAGLNLRAMADRLGVSYATAKRRHRRFLSVLSRKLKCGESQEAR